ncbi:hypothetical protein FI667_g2451, partial [Globisporangium splendens]
MELPKAGNAALPGFVSTAVLTSSDGVRCTQEAAVCLFGDNVEEQRISEAPAPNAQDAADYKPLYERLQELKDKKDSEWKEKHNPFAPPKALDDEEIQFIRDLEDRQAASELQRKTQHNEDLAEFLLARESAKQSGGSNAAASGSGVPTINASIPSQTSTIIKKKSAAAPVVVRAKRKADDKKPKKKQPSGGDKKQKVDDEDAVAKEKSDALTTAKPATAVMGLVAYGSDSDSE